MSVYQGFNQTQLNKPKRSTFDLSHEKRIATRMGKLVPVFISETLPNDTFRCNTEMMLRLAPMIAPVMHRINVTVHFFFVANRLLWRDWELFITNGRLGTETPPVPPNATIQNICNRTKNLLDVSSLADYLGVGTIPDASGGTYGVSTTLDLMPHAAFYKIWYDYYRDRNFVADNTILPLASGAHSTAATLDALFEMKNRDWAPEYFDTSLPWTQRGNSVLMPMIGTGSVTYLATSLVKTNAGANAGVNTLVGVGPTTPGDMFVNKIDATTAGALGRIENISGVNVTNSSVTINDFRTAERLQEWMERQALAGSRYNETIFAHFARRTSDGRLQMAEYLGGGKVPVKISEVVTTAYSEDASPEVVPAGAMAGHGLSFGNTNRFTYNCEEHGFVIGIASIMPAPGYMQGTRRMFLARNTFLSYPWPLLAHLGEQPVLKYELYTDPANITSDRSLQPVFGYNSRYVDWKYIPSTSHGEFKTSLEMWHLDRKFSSNPSLSATFNTFEDSLQNRIFNVIDGSSTCWAYIYNNCTVKRSLPYYGTPRL